MSTLRMKLSQTAPALWRKTRNFIEEQDACHGRELEIAYGIQAVGRGSGYRMAGGGKTGGKNWEIHCHFVEDPYTSPC
jgi:hypothetical protein